MCWYIAPALCGPSVPPPLVIGGGIVPCVLSCPTLDFAVSLRVKLGPNVDEIIFAGVELRTQRLGLRIKNQEGLCRLLIIRIRVWNK